MYRCIFQCVFEFFISIYDNILINSGAAGSSKHQKRKTIIWLSCSVHYNITMTHAAVTIRINTLCFNGAAVVTLVRIPYTWLRDPAATVHDSWRFWWSWYVYLIGKWLELGLGLLSRVCFLELMTSLWQLSQSRALWFKRCYWWDHSQRIKLHYEYNVWISINLRCRMWTPNAAARVCRRTCSLAPARCTATSAPRPPRPCWWTPCAGRTHGPYPIAAHRTWARPTWGVSECRCECEWAWVENGSEEYVAQGERCEVWTTS